MAEGSVKQKKGPIDVWSIREKLALASAVIRSGDQNWMSVSRSIKPFINNDRPNDWISQINCARQYSDLLEKEEIPRRKRGERDMSTDTPGNIIVRKLTSERIDELKQFLSEQAEKYRSIKKEIEMIKSGQMDGQIKEMYSNLQIEKSIKQEKDEDVVENKEIISSSLNIPSQSDADDSTQDSIIETKVYVKEELIQECPKEEIIETDSIILSSPQSSNLFIDNKNEKSSDTIEDGNRISLKSIPVSNELKLKLSLNEDINGSTEIEINLKTSISNEEDILKPLHVQSESGSENISKLISLSPSIDTPQQVLDNTIKTEEITKDEEKDALNVSEFVEEVSIEFEDFDHLNKINTLSNHDKINNLSYFVDEEDMTTNDEASNDSSIIKDDLLESTLSKDNLIEKNNEPNIFIVDETNNAVIDSKEGEKEGIDNLIDIQSIEIKEDTSDIQPEDNTLNDNNLNCNENHSSIVTSKQETFEAVNSDSIQLSPLKISIPKKLTSSIKSTSSPQKIVIINKMALASSPFKKQTLKFSENNIKLININTIKTTPVKRELNEASLDVERTISKDKKTDDNEADLYLMEDNLNIDVTDVVVEDSILENTETNSADLDICLNVEQNNIDIEEQDINSIDIRESSIIKIDSNGNELEVNQSPIIHKELDVVLEEGEVINVDKLINVENVSPCQDKITVSPVSKKVKGFLTMESPPKEIIPLASKKDKGLLTRESPSKEIIPLSSKKDKGLLTRESPSKEIIPLASKKDKGFLTRESPPNEIIPLASNKDKVFLTKESSPKEIISLDSQKDKGFLPRESPPKEIIPLASKNDKGFLTGESPPKEIIPLDTEKDKGFHTREFPPTVIIPLASKNDKVYLNRGSPSKEIIPLGSKKDKGSLTKELPSKEIISPVLKKVKESSTRDSPPKDNTSSVSKKDTGYLTRESPLKEVSSTVSNKIKGFLTRELPPKKIILSEESSKNKFDLIYSNNKKISYETNINKNELNHLKNYTFSNRNINKTNKPNNEIGNFNANFEPTNTREEIEIHNNINTIFDSKDELKYTNINSHIINSDSIYTTNDSYKLDNDNSLNENVDLAASKLQLSTSSLKDKKAELEQTNNILAIDLKDECEILKNDDNTVVSDKIKSDINKEDDSLTFKLKIQEKGSNKTSILKRKGRFQKANPMLKRENSNKVKVETSDDEVEQASIPLDHSFGSTKPIKLDFNESLPNSPASLSNGDTEDEKAHKVWKKSIMLVWRAISNHRSANIFVHPVTEDIAPGYHTVVFRPMDLNTIRKNIDFGIIRTTGEFQRDMMIMFTNAIMYNNSRHNVHKMARAMYLDAMMQIEQFVSTQMMMKTEPKLLRTLRRSDISVSFDKDDDSRKRKPHTMTDTLETPPLHQNTTALHPLTQQNRKRKHSFN